MQAFIIFTIFSVLVAPRILAGPIGRYPMMRRNAETGETPRYTNTSSIEAPASTSTSIGGILLAPRVLESTSELVSEIVQTHTFNLIDGGATTIVLTEMSTNTISRTTVAVSEVITSAETTSPTSKAAVTTSASAVVTSSNSAIDDATSTAQIAPTSEPITTTSEPTSATSSDASPTSSSVPSKAQNIQLAIKENQFYATLTTTSKCDPNDPSVFNACIGGIYAQCNAAGTYTPMAECRAPLRCFALPLERDAGMSISCTTVGDAAFRMGFSSTAEFNSAMGDGNAGDSSTAPVPTVTSSAASTALPVGPTSSALQEPTTTTSAVGETSAGVPTASAVEPTISSTVQALLPTISSTVQALLPTSSSSEATTSTTSATETTATSLPTQEPNLPAPTHTTLSFSSITVPTSTSRPGNRAPVVTPIPIGQRSITSTVIAGTITIHG